MDVVKASGEKEQYSREKFCASLLKAGIPADLVEEVCRKIETKVKPGITTEQLRVIASKGLVRENPVFLARYNLKNAIMELGPAGFLFEQYVAAVLREYGYTAKTNQILQGVCVDHEIDILAEKENHHFFIEAKYHNARGIKSDVTIAMYSYARFLDIKEASEKSEKSFATHNAWIITNTKFTSKAIEYAQCRGVKITGWQYPRGESLELLIERKVLYPITILPSLSNFAREQFSKAGIMFAKEIIPYEPSQLSREFGIPFSLAKSLSKEVSVFNE